MAEVETKRVAYPFGKVAEMTAEEIRAQLAERGFDFSRRIRATFEPHTEEIVYEQGAEE
jgi:hypothetical protein